MKKNSPKRGYAWLRTARNGSFLLSGYFPSLGGLARIALEARRGIYSILILKGKQWEETTLRIGRARKRTIRMLSVQSARSTPKESVEAHAVVLSSAKRVLRRNLTIASDGSRKWNFEDRLRDGSIVTGEGTRSKGRNRKAKLIRRRTDAKGKEVWTTKSETTWGVGKLSATVSKITSKRSDGTSGQTHKLMWQDAAGWHSRAQTSWSKQDGGRASSGKGGASTDYSSDCGRSSTGGGVTTTWTTLTTNTYNDGSQQIIARGETEDRSYDGVSTQFQGTSMEVGSDEQITGASNSSGESWEMAGPGISIRPTTSTGDEAGSGPNEGPYFKGQGSWGSHDEGPFGADDSVTGESGVESKSDSMGTSTQTGWADSEAGHSDTIVQTNEDGSQTITTTTTDKNGDGTQHTTTLDPDGNETGDSTKDVHGTTGGTDSGGSGGSGDNSGTSGGSNNSGGSGGSGDGQGGDNSGDNGDHGSGGPQAPEGGGGGESGMDWDEGGGSEGSPRTLPKHAGHVIDEIDGGEDSGGRGGGGDGGEGDGGEGGDFGPRMGSLLVKIVDVPDDDGQGVDTTPQHPVDVSRIKIKAPPGADEGGWGGSNNPRAIIAFTANLIAGLTRSKGLSPQNLANLSSAALLNRSLGAQASALTTLNKI